MFLNDLKAEFSHAYVRAVAHAAGFFVQEANRAMDGDGVDLMLIHRGVAGVVSSPRLDLQLKATAAPIKADPFPFDLDVKNYNELCGTSWQIPRILVVVVVPAKTQHWVKATEQQLVLRRSGYWISLRGNSPTTNDTTCRVHLSRTNCFHVPNLIAIMSGIRNGVMP